MLKLLMKMMLRKSIAFTQNYPHYLGRTRGRLTLTVNRKLPGLLHSLMKQLLLPGTRAWIYLLAHREVMLAQPPQLLPRPRASCSRSSAAPARTGKKSVISAMILLDRLLPHDALVGAAHSCRFDDAATSGTFELLSSLAAQLAVSVEGFEASVDTAAVVVAREKGDTDLLSRRLSRRRCAPPSLVMASGTSSSSSTRSTSCRPPR